MHTALSKNHQERGATAIEFSIVFALLFGVFWAVISYSLPFFMYQVMNYATAEAARFAVRADPSNLQSNLESLATEAVNDRLAVLPHSFRAKLGAPEVVVTSVTIPGVATPLQVQELVVRLRYRNYNANPIIPTLNIPGIGRIPNIPGDILAESSMRIDI